jgi:hypothetical protein
MIKAKMLQKLKCDWDKYKLEHPNHIVLIGFKNEYATFEQDAIDTGAVIKSEPLNFKYDNVKVKVMVLHSDYVFNKLGDIAKVRPTMMIDNL